MNFLKISLLFFCFSHQLYASTLTDYSKEIISTLKKSFKVTNCVLTPIDVIASKPLRGIYYKVEHKNSKICYVYAGRVFTGRGSQTNENSDYFDYLIFFNQYKTVELIKVVNISTTHAEGITSTGWLSQFKGYNSTKSLSVGREVDAVSGATISVNRMCFDVRQKAALLDSVK